MKCYFQFAGVLCGLVLLCLSNILSADKQFSISDADVAIFKERFDELNKKKFSSRKKIDAYEKSYKKKGIYEARLKKMNRNYLYALMDIERDLAILATPKKAITQTINVPGFSSRENSQIAKIRLEIAMAERARIKKGIEAKRADYGDEKFHLNLLKKEIILWESYFRLAKKIDRAIAKLEKEIFKERTSTMPYKDKLKKLELKKEGLFEEKKEISNPIFGYAVGSGFDQNVTPSLDAAADLLAAFKKEREEAIHFLRTGETNKGESEKRGGKIGSAYIYSENLGVVLDISGSMTKFIEPLKGEIADSFESPHFREIDGCSLNAFFRYPTVTLHTTSRERTMHSFAELLIVNQVDTLYWFSDLMDVQKPVALRKLLDMLIRSGVVFNVKSVNREPSKLLEPMITYFEKE